MRKIRVLFYIDSSAMLTHCVTAAEAIRNELEADIIVMMVDAKKNFIETMTNYEIYDYGNLFGIPKKFVPIWPPVTASNNKRRPLRIDIRLLGARSGIETAKRIAKQSKIPQAITVPLLVVLILTFRLLRIEKRLIRRLRRAAKKNWPPPFTRNALRRLSALQRATRSELRRPRGIEQMLRRCFAFDALRSGGRVGPAPKDETLENSFTGGIGRLFDRMSGLFRVLWRLLACARGVDDFLLAVEPDVIILAEENVETLSTIFVTKGRKRNIPAIIIPFTIPNPLEPAEYYLNNPLFHANSFLARRLITHYPKWLFRYKDKDLLRLPALRVLFQEILGFTSPAPWVLNRGEAVSIALDSEAQRDVYLDLGFPAAQLRTIGDLNLGNISRTLTNKARLSEELCTSHDLQPGRPLIVCGFPPDQYGGTNEAEFEFPNYEKLVEAWIASFKALGNRANFLVRPHPRMPHDRFAGLDDSNIRFTWQATADLIPLSDLYIASISATIRWAIACGIPAVNYDTYRYRYNDYASASGVITVETVDEFRVLIGRFIEEPAFSAELSRRQRSMMPYWGSPDGNAPERLSTLVVEIVTEAGR